MDNQNNTPQRLYESALYGDLEAVKQAIESGTHPDTLYEPGFTLLDAAVLTQRPELIRYLLSSGASVDIHAPDGYTLLYREAINSNQEIHFKRAMYFMKIGANVNSRGPKGETPLMAAAFAGNAALVEALLKAGADVFATDDAGKSALNYASPNLQSDKLTIDILTRAVQKP